MPGDPIHPFVFRHPVSASSHLLFAGWALYSAALLRKRTRDPARRSAVAAFGASLVALYLASGLYHAAPADRPALVEWLRRLDLSLIHVLIAGTSTLACVLLPARPRLVLLALAWGVAGVGVLAKWALPLPPARVTIGLYVASGLLVVPALGAVAREAGRRGLALLLGGASVYAIGAACEAAGAPVAWPGVIGPHEILHLCDMVGSTAHLAFAARLAAGWEPGRRCDLAPTR